MDNLLHDLRVSGRRLRKAPGFTLIAVLSLALGIGANTAIFSLVNTVLLRPLPIAKPEQLVALNVAAEKGGETLPTFSYPNYRDIRDRNNVLSGLITYRIAPLSLSYDGSNERVWGYLASGNYFDVLGVQPARGRLFTPDDDKAPGAHPVMVISYNYWQKHFAADPHVIGRGVIVNGHPFTIIGVAPAGFHGTEISYVPEMWFPVMMSGQIEPGNFWLERRNTQNLFVQGRLKDGIGMRQAEAALQNIAAQLAREYPEDNEGGTITLSPPGLFGSFMHGPIVGFAGVLMAVVGLVLLLACTNLANLLLARATERRKEIAVRLALGARRWQLIKQLLTESVMLAVLGGAVGVVLAFWLVDALMAFKPPMDVPLTTKLHIDHRVLLYAALISLVTGVIFGLLPALQATKTDLVPALKDEISLGGYRRSWLRSGLVVLQISVSLVLLICAGLVLRGLYRAQFLNPGFITHNAIELSFDLGLQGYDDARSREFQRQLLERVRALPSVQHAGLADFVPLSMNMSNNSIHVEGQPAARGANAPTAMTGTAGPGFLQALGVQLRAGRDFSEQDEAGKPRVAIVNETFARRFWQGAPAIGKRFSFRGAEGPWVEVVGVIQDGKYFSLSEAATPFVYNNLQQDNSNYLSLVVRTTTEPSGVIAAIRREMQMLDANLPVFNVQTMTQHMSLPLFPARVAATLLGAFGLLALLLAAIGIFGVMSYLVSQRTREIGIRLALGARAADVFKLVIGHGLLLTAIGAGIGLVIAFTGTRLMANLLYGVSAVDRLTFAGVTSLLALVAFLACYVPARRAMKTDPIRALRHE